MLTGTNGWARFAPKEMTLKEIKSELSADKLSSDDCKEKLWRRLIALRTKNAISENSIKPFGGPALDVLVTKLICKKWPILDSNTLNEVVRSLKMVFTKEIAGHVANYVEIPKYFGPSNSTAYYKKCLWKCKHICFCNELSRSYACSRGNSTWSFRKREYEDLENAWYDARKEWEVMQQPKIINEAKENVELAPSLNAILPYDICELISHKLAESINEDPYKTIETKKELVRIVVSTRKLLLESKESMKQTKKRLDRCGQAARLTAKKTGKEIILSPLVEKNKLLLTREYEEKSNAYSAIFEETKNLEIRCKNEGVVYSSICQTWVPL